MSGTISTTEEEVVEETTPPTEEVVAEDKKEEEVSEEAPKEEVKAEEKSEEKEQEVPKVPESYEDFTLPEGLEPDEARSEEFKGVAKELGLSQEQAQGLVTFALEAETKAAEAQVKDWEATQDQWRSDTKNDEEIGGEKLKETRVDVSKAVGHFGNDAFKELLDITGVGDHVEMVRFLSKVGALMKEGGLNVDNSEVDTPKDPAKVMFPNMN